MKYRYEFGAMSCIKEFGFEFVELDLTSSASPQGSTVKIRHWQICPYHWSGGKIKRKTKTNKKAQQKCQITHLLTWARFAQSLNASLSQFPSISFKMHWHYRICEIFQSKCQIIHSGDGPMAQIGNMLRGNSNYRKHRAFSRTHIMH